ncbi:hypothetical protein V8G54_029681 [Vigna mungo]|uniref:Uncharacterized protein n=1 Tax=Vigna mungo TaxID=3915 RepID=A0AAQ3MVG5_VIGMU
MAQEKESRPIFHRCLQLFMNVLGHDKGYAITTTDSTTPGQYRVDMLSESLPFIQKFCGKTIVVKYGGATMNKAKAIAAGLSGLDGYILTACPNPKVVNLGFVGVARVDPAVLRSFIACCRTHSSNTISNKL